MSAKGWDNKVFSVEVSGWDAERQFFVERTTLYTDQYDARNVLLSNKLRNGLLVFVRPLNANFTGKTYPRIYRVESVELPDLSGLSKVRLAFSQPVYETLDAEDATFESSEHLTTSATKLR